jgi:peptidoglycan/LPS O-acetylase OafA/YrhL
MEYRKEIDGLRALAVLAVIFYHAGFGIFSGGFVGVDIFFVISGYLITTIIISDLSNNKFSIVNFYERRIRRILPALFFILFLCIPLSIIFFLPDELRKFSKSVVAVSLYFSNIQFLKESGYFDIAAEMKPLLHTWSLAVEEQFYVFFPLFMVGIWRFQKKVVFIAVLILSIASLVLSQIAIDYKPDASFFLLPTRIWELSAGSLVALYFFCRPQKSVTGVLPQILSLLGVFLIIYSVFLFNESTPFPGIYALIPVIGTVLVISCAWSDTYVGKFLSYKFFVSIGLISYSAYLWHHPIFVFYRYASLDEINKLTYCFLIVATFIFAYFSWKFVEQPFRRKNYINRKHVFIFAAVGTLFFVGAGLSLQKFSKLNFHEVLPENIVQSFEGSDRKSECFDKSNVHVRDDWTCTIGDVRKEPSFLLAGDSHALSMLDVFDAAATHQEVSGVFVGASGCPPLQGVHALRDDQHDKNCFELNRRILNYVVSSNIKNVYLVGRWTYYTDGGYDGRNFSYLGLSKNDAKNIDNSRLSFEKGVEMTIHDFSKNNIKVSFVAQVPQQKYNPKQVYRKLYVNDELDFSNIKKYSVKKTEHIKLQSYVLSILGERFNGNIVDFIDLFCKEDKCHIGDENGSYYL